MKISQNGINLIKKYEGCRLTAYDDGTGVLTIGYGHTKNVQKGMIITQAKAEQYLKEDLERFENGVKQAIKVSLNQNQFDSLVSFAYNCGEYALLTSTLAKKINAKETIKEDYFTMWNKAGGKVLEGLTNRRKAEYNLFISGQVINTSTYKPTILYLQQNINLDGGKVMQDGILGTQTLNALPLLKYGSRGHVVKWVQSKLNLNVDGIYGAETEKAIFKFQSSCGLTRDGIVGKNTWLELTK